MIKKSEKKIYRTYSKSEAIQDLIDSVGENGITNNEYETYCELKGFCYPNRKKQKKK